MSIETLDPPAKTALHPAEQYAKDVLSGAIVVGKWVDLAVKRQENDLKTAAARGIFFDRTAAERAIKFFSFLKHSKGEWAGQPVTLEPWEQFILWVLFGWKKTDSDGHIVRRFRTSYAKIARKNGKSTFAAGVGLYLFCADDEQGAEVYTAATKREQARIVHGEAVAMVQKSEALKRRVRVFKDNLHIVESRSKFEPLGADEDTTDGLNVHGAIIDELHAHKTRGMLDVLDSGTGARRQPMIFVITTAGLDNIGVDQDMQKYAEKVLTGAVADDSFFAIIYAIDKFDNWQDEGCWIKANPNLGVSVKIDDLRAKARKAAAMPSALNEFLCKHMNRSVKQITSWLPIEKWNECGAPMDDSSLTGIPCYVGIDLSSKVDVTAVAFVFPPTTEGFTKWRIKVRLFVPEETALTRERDANVPYATWGRDGFIDLTPGNVIDYSYVKKVIFDAARIYDIVEVAYDGWNATQIGVQLEEQGLKVFEVNQGYRSLSEPTKELERIVTSKGLWHDGNPALNWMAGNVAIETDPAGNIKPSKRGSTEKIDGIAAIVTAMARALVSENGTSVYDKKELMVL